MAVFRFGLTIILRRACWRTSLTLRDDEGVEAPSEHSIDQGVLPSFTSRRSVSEVVDAGR